MKTLIIIILILLVLGLYFATSATKGVIKATGKATLRVINNTIVDVNSSDTAKDVRQKITDTISGKAVWEDKEKD